MAVVKREEYTQPRVLDLAGPEGNAYVLLGIAHGLLEEQGMDPDMYITMMKSGDYGNLVRLFNELFGEFFTIVLPAEVETLEDL